VALNGDTPWDEFDSGAYLRDNYLALRDDDREIVELVRDFFAGADFDVPLRGIDVGSGTNIYPALAMLPWCDHLDLCEYSTQNVEWLKNEIRSYSSSWDPFWDVLSHEPAYRGVDNPREALLKHAQVWKESVFALPERTWDIGTMFFVAESLSEQAEEFQLAVRKFVSALRPGAPFAAAFMENSTGYDVGRHRFPAVSIGLSDVRECLAGRSADLLLDRINIGSDPLREGYSGMILARGRRVS
jgi:hypothetical protein